MQENQHVGLDVKATLRFHQQFLLLSSPSSNRRGLMDSEIVGGLANSISRFIHLITCQTVKTVPVQNDYRNMISALKLLKHVLDEVGNSKIPSDELLLKFEELDVAVNEAREFVERWCPKMSKICAVLQSEQVMVKVYRLLLEVCHTLSRLLQSSSLNSYLSCVQNCIQALQCPEQERTSILIEGALRDQKDNLLLSTQHLIKIVELLGLTSSQELLLESMALEKERAKPELTRNMGEADYINQIIDLVAHIRDAMVKQEQFKAINGVPIPSYFRCPLSMELMLDPVIVASGLTYERAFIQKWLDQGLRNCPKSRQTLAHTNLIPNYTVKALIASWCENNNIRFFDSAESNNISSRFLSHGVLEDFICSDSFRGSLHSHSTSQSSLEVENEHERRRIEISSGIGELDNYPVNNSICSNGHLHDKVISKRKPSLEHSYSHSRSESVSSAVSSVDSLPTVSVTALAEVSRVCSKRDNVSGEVMSEEPSFSPSHKDSNFSPCVSGRQLQGLKVPNRNETDINQFSCSSSLLDSGDDDLTADSSVEKLVEDLNSQSNEAQTAAAAEVRRLAKHNMENRVIIAKCGAIRPLVSLLYSKVKVAQENAVTALLNLSINDNNKTSIAEEGAIEPLIHVLKSGNTVAKENSAATLFSLSVLEKYKIKIGRSAAVKALVDLLGSGTLRGKKDAATALFNLSIFHENKARIVQAGAVKYLVELLDPDKGMTEKALALLANLSTISEGRAAIAREGGVPLLVEVIDTGSQRGKENAASALLQLCINSHKFCTLVLQEGAVPPLVALTQSGTPRAKEKAQQILCHFRNQREGSVGKAKS